MSLKIFDKIKHFKLEDFDHPDMLDDITLQMLDDMVEQEGWVKKISIKMHADFAYSGHSDKSMHYMGKAFDVSILDTESGKPLPIIEQFLIAIRYFWTGIGIYPRWNSPGLHLDTRPITRFTRRTFWYLDRDGNYNKSIKQFLSEEGVKI